MDGQPIDLPPDIARKLMRMPSALVAQTVRFAVAHGVPWARVTAETGLGPADLIAADAWLPASVVLADPRLSIDAVAEAVGHADRRAFSRAFKRWSGQTPAAFHKARS